MSEQLAPFSNQDLVGMSCKELCLLSELTSIRFTQFTVIVVDRVATEGPNLASGLQSSWISILYYACIDKRDTKITTETLQC